jgi:hypothetical protein
VHENCRTNGRFPNEIDAANEHRGVRARRYRDHEIFLSGAVRRQVKARLGVAADGAASQIDLREEQGNRFALYVGPKLDSETASL